jgi:hypothetical protein
MVIMLYKVLGRPKVTQYSAQRMRIQRYALLAVKHFAHRGFEFFLHARIVHACPVPCRAYPLQGCRSAAYANASHSAVYLQEKYDEIR